MRYDVKHLREFDSFEDFLEVCKKPKNPHCRNAESKNFSDGDEWDNGSDWNDTLKMSSEGWPEGREQVDEVSRRLFDVIKPQTHQQDTVYQLDGGSYIDVGRYVEGEPECFGDFINAENPTKIFRIEVSVAFACNIQASNIIRRGAALVALVDILEVRGYRCEIVVTNSVKNRGSDKDKEASTTSVTVKDPAQPIEVDRLAFCMAHPCYLRRLWFASMECESNKVIDKYRIGGGYGVPSDIKSSDCDLYIPKITYQNEDQFKTESACVKWIKNIIKKNNLLNESELQNGV